MNALKDRIAEALAASGKTQTELAKACDVKTPSVNDWLSGKTKSMKAAPAQRAAAFLGVNMLWLTEGRGPKASGESVTYATTVLPSSNSPAREDATEYVSHAITYEVIKGAVSGVLQAMGVRYEDLVDNEHAARQRIETAISGAPRSQDERETDLRITGGKIVRTQAGMVKTNREPRQKRKPA